MPVTTPAETPLNNPEDNPIMVPVFADAAKIILTAGAPRPPLTTDTVTQIRITPVPIATFFSICSYVSSYSWNSVTIVCPSSPRVNTYRVPWKYASSSESVYPKYMFSCELYATSSKYSLEMYTALTFSTKYISLSSSVTRFV